MVLAPRLPRRLLKSSGESDNGTDCISVCRSPNPTWINACNVVVRVADCQQTSRNHNALHPDVYRMAGSYNHMVDNMTGDIFWVWLAATMVCGFIILQYL